MKGNVLSQLQESELELDAVWNSFHLSELSQITCCFWLVFPRVLQGVEKVECFLLHLISPTEKPLTP